jgi:hypothetical protein
VGGFGLFIPVRLGECDVRFECVVGGVGKEFGVFPANIREM